MLFNGCDNNRILTKFKDRKNTSGTWMYLTKLYSAYRAKKKIGENKMEKDLSPDVLVAVFTNMSLHTEITLFMIFP